MDATRYDSWYQTPRGRWIGQREAALVVKMLRPETGDSLLDVGCGTGFFTRTFAATLDGVVMGVDVNPEWIAYAQQRDPHGASYGIADVRALPYADASFDLTVSITALCFVEPERRALREILRVTRRRFAIGLLNRHSILYRHKGHTAGGAYDGAHWHTAREVQRLFSGLPVQHLQLRSVIHFPSGGRLARGIERAWPTALPTGALLLAAGEVVHESEPFD